MKICKGLKINIIYSVELTYIDISWTRIYEVKGFYSNLHQYMDFSILVINFNSKIVTFTKDFFFFLNENLCINFNRDIREILW